MIPGLAKGWPDINPRVSTTQNLQRSVITRHCWYNLFLLVPYYVATIDKNRNIVICAVWAFISLYKRNNLQHMAIKGDLFNCCFLEFLFGLKAKDSSVWAAVLLDGPVVKNIVSYLKVRRTDMLELLLCSHGGINGSCISLGPTQVYAYTNSFNMAQSAG
jgi:hypothetical protein